MPATRSRRRATAAANMSLLNDSPAKPYFGGAGGGEGETSMTMLMDQSLRLTPRTGKGKKRKGKASTVDEDSPQQFDDIDDAELSRLAWGEAAGLQTTGTASPPAPKEQDNDRQYGTPDQKKLPLIAFSPNVETRRKRAPRKTTTPKAMDEWPQEDVTQRGPASSAPLPEPVKKEATAPLMEESHLPTASKAHAASRLPTRAKARPTSIAAIVAGSRAAAAAAAQAQTEQGESSRRVDESKRSKEGRQERRKRLGLEGPEQLAAASSPSAQSSSPPKRRLTSLLSFSPSKGKNLVPAASSNRHASSSSSLLMSSSSPLRSQQRRVQREGAKGNGNGSSGSELLRLMGKTPSPKKQRQREEVAVPDWSSSPLIRLPVVERATGDQLVDEVEDEQEQYEEQERAGGVEAWKEEEGAANGDEESLREEMDIENTEHSEAHGEEWNGVEEEDAEALPMEQDARPQDATSPEVGIEEEEEHFEEQEQEQEDPASPLHDESTSPQPPGHEVPEAMSLDNATDNDSGAAIASPSPLLAQDIPAAEPARPRRSSRRSSILPQEAASDVKILRHEEAPAVAAVTPSTRTVAKKSSQPTTARKTRSSLSSSAAKGPRQVAAERDAKLAQARQKVAAAAVARNATTSQRAVIGSSSPAKKTKVTRGAVPTSAGSGATRRLAEETMPQPSTARVRSTPAAAAPRKPSAPVKQPTTAADATRRATSSASQQSKPIKDVPAGFRLTSTGQLVPVATTSAAPPVASKPRRTRTAPLASSVSYTPSAAHLSSLLAATEASAAAAAAAASRTTTATTDVPAYLARRREEVQRDAEEELARRIQRVRREEGVRSSAGGGAGERGKGAGRFAHLNPALLGPKPSTSSSSSTTRPSSSSAPAAPSALTLRLESRRAWETSRRARDALVEAERLAAREERERMEAEELKRERERRCPKANPVPVGIYGEGSRRGRRGGVKEEETGVGRG